MLCRLNPRVKGLFFNDTENKMIKKIEVLIPE